ncbi:MAG: hypothetical protein COW00_11095 [Bdellovibrio sp. CG12_big_fil_rev_8_21_14_0_65_39_13]|nr:MAG: hypothetical protein COW78_16450 [Bdellovibrio sp. CG22_combo_CG10-13_8_21_14_all_39_27]PIQ59267.1 MAG: hypothetical protein COW00_11095 [Bdellovibrio sp. CG12_big_fil_rev_8_21_14_0_65_39_13]PIR32278.1 MAG: hypothetical protein COV37_20385 [Bdellovibrio sp. CG11_big_fil_rev_8_21_14_0_20_39_38]PJB54545.1 MAG: hypothetical protein CO099_00940 [Bdellovibrio sp. CG_4_9_14_3_um_filter_39_7]
MKKLFVLFVFLFSVGAYPQSVQEGEGRFFSKDEDNLVFIKQQLLYQSFKQILTKEMDTLGLDSKAFWQRYEDQFENYFKPIEESLKEKTKPEESAKNRTDFEKALRTQKLNAQARYGRIQRAIQSYSIKKMSRSPQVPNSRFMNVEAKVDRKNLTDLYMSFIKSGSREGYAKLYLMTDFQLVNSTWSDTGVDLESDFTSVVNDHWKKWLLESGGVGISEVIVADNSLISQFENRIHRSEVLATEQHEAGELWLKVNLRLNKTNEDNVLQKRTFHVTGEYVLLDSQSNFVLDKGDFPTEIGSFSTQDLHQFSSQLASMIYRMPVSFWGKFSQIISSPIPSQFLKIKISNIKNVSDAIAISDLINQIGVVKKATAGLVRLRGNEAEIGIRFFGDGSEMLNMLKGLVGREIQNQVIKSIENAGPLEWSLSPSAENSQEKVKSST